MANLHEERTMVEKKMQGRVWHGPNVPCVWRTLDPNGNDDNRNVEVLMDRSPSPPSHRPGPSVGLGIGPARPKAGKRNPPVSNQARENFPVRA